MNQPFEIIDDLAGRVTVQEESIVSRTVYEDDFLKAVVFAFDTGQELSEHTASKPAILHLIKGEMTIGLGEHSCEARPGTWIHMQPNLVHRVLAKTPSVLLLYLMKKPAQGNK